MKSDERVTYVQYIAYHIDYITHKDLLTTTVLPIGPLEEILKPLAPKDQATPAPLGTRCINLDTVVNQSCLIFAARHFLCRALLSCSNMFDACEILQVKQARFWSKQGNLRRLHRSQKNIEK